MGTGATRTSDTATHDASEKIVRTARAGATRKQAGHSLFVHATEAHYGRSDGICTPTDFFAGGDARTESSSSVCYRMGPSKKYVHDYLKSFLVCQVPPK